LDVFIVMRRNDNWRGDAEERRDDNK